MIDIGLIVSFAGIVVAGTAGVLGVWMERDPEAPPRWAWVFSGLILVATGIEMTHSMAQASEDAETEEAMARVLEQLASLAESGDNPALAQFVGSELAAQARANPQVMQRIEKKVAAKGGDPAKLKAKAAEARRSNAGLPAKRTTAGARPTGTTSRAGARPGDGARDGADDRARGEGPRGEGERGAGEAGLREVPGVGPRAGAEGPKDAIDGAAKALPGGAKGAVDGAKGAVEGAKAAGDAAKGAVDGAKGAADSAKGAVDAVKGGDAKKAADGAKKAADDAKGALGSVPGLGGGKK